MAYCSRYKVILVGDYGVGKTSLFKRLRGESFHEQPSSTLSKGVGREKCTKSYTLHNGDLVMLDIWDTAGAERYQTITHSYYAYAHAVVFVYDNSDDRSIYNLNSWIEDADRFAPDAVQILLGNKYDLTDANPASLHSGISPDKFAHDCGIEQHFKVSAKEDNRVQETFEAIARYLHYRTDLDDSTKRREQNQSFCIGISDEQVRSQTKCCTGSAYSQM